MPLTSPQGLARRPRAVVIALAIAACALTPCIARTHPTSAAAGPDAICQVKSAFLLNFIRFVDWPADTARTPAGTWQVTVLGDSCFAHALSHMVAGKTVKGRALAVRSVKRLEDAYPCHALFVGPGAESSVRAAAAPDSAHAILTIGEQGPFEQSGGMIWFVVSEDRVRFAINKSAVRLAGLNVSSKLLDLAVAVRSGDRGARR